MEQTGWRREEGATVKKEKDEEKEDEEEQRDEEEACGRKTVNRGVQVVRGIQGSR